MHRSGLTIGFAALLLGLGGAWISPKPAYAQRNPCLGDGFSTQEEIDRRCAAAHGRAPAPRGYDRPRGYEGRYGGDYERRDDRYGYDRGWRRDPYEGGYAPRRSWRYDDDY